MHNSPIHWLIRQGYSLREIRYLYISISPCPKLICCLFQLVKNDTDPLEKYLTVPRAVFADNWVANPSIGAACIERYIHNLWGGAHMEIKIVLGILSNERNRQLPWERLGQKLRRGKVGMSMKTI
jgi:hypothetical protein